DVLRHLAVLGRAPRHHGRHPGALGERDGTNAHGAEQQGCRRGLAARRHAWIRLVNDSLGRLPHGPILTKYSRMRTLPFAAGAWTPPSRWSDMDFGTSVTLMRGAIVIAGLRLGDFRNEHI